MRGRFKGALIVDPRSSPTQSIVQRTVALAHELSLTPVFVGQPQDATALSSFSVALIRDVPVAEGPLAGVASCCAHLDAPFVLVGCDMPYLSADILLRFAQHRGSSPIVASRLSPDDPWQPLCARYIPRLVKEHISAMIEQRESLSFQRLFRRCGVDELTLTQAEHDTLRDWDEPKDCAI